MNSSSISPDTPLQDGAPVVSVATVFQDQIALGTQVRVRGWLRTRRDSKAGFSFLTLSDGSCLQPLQILVDQQLANYQSELLHLTTGCSLVVKCSSSGWSLLQPQHWSLLTAGLSSAFVISLLTIRGALYLVQRLTLLPFALYRLLLAIILYGLLL